MNNKKSLNIQHILLQAIYTMIGVSIYTYASNFLLYKGYSNTEIGIIISVSSLSSILLQPIIASITDKSKKYNVIEVMLVLFIACALMFVPQFIIKNESIVLTLMFIGVYCITDAVSPLLNIVGWQIEEFGVKSDYGFARSFGSISFALFNGIIGNIINNFSENSIAVCGLFSTILMCITLLWMDATFRKSKKVVDIKKQENTISMKEFIVNHKDLLLIFITIAIFMFSDVIGNYYLIQIITPLGGTALDQGYLALMWALTEVPGMMLFSKLNKRFSIESLLIFSAIIYALKSVGLYISNNMLMIYLTLSLQWGSFAIFQPAIVEYINSKTKDEEKARGQALKTTICCIGTMITSSISGIIIDNFGIKKLLLIGLLVSITGTILFACFVRKTKNND